MKIGMQIISNDKTVRSDTIQDSKEINNSTHNLKQRKLKKEKY